MDTTLYTEGLGEDGLEDGLYDIGEPAAEPAPPTSTCIVDEVRVHSGAPARPT